MSQPYYLNYGALQGAGFRITVDHPIDVRTVVRLKADLVDPNTWANVHLYHGMCVSVTLDPIVANCGLYMLVINSGTNYQTFGYPGWIKIGSEGGVDGSQILSGAVDPTTEGADGDWYINTISWDLFQKVSNIWVNKGNIKGEDGKTPYIGENGNWWIGNEDTGVPASPGGGGGCADDISLCDEITVTGVTVGNLEDGTTLPEGMTLMELLNAMLRKQVPPIYVAPTTNLILTPGTSSVEVGTQFTCILNGVYTQNDGGPVTGFSYSGFNLLSGEMSPPIHSYQLPTIVTVPEGTVTCTFTVNYAAGAIKNDNFGEPYPTGQIPGGILSSSKTYTGFRNMFYQTSLNPILSTTSAHIRALTGRKLNPVVGGSTNISFPAGTKHFVIAYPANLGQVTSILQVGAANLEVKDAFTLSNIMVEGNNNYTPINYNIYTYSALTGWNAADTFIVII